MLLFAFSRLCLSELNSEAISRETVVEKQPFHTSNSVLIQSRAELQVVTLLRPCLGLRFIEIHSHLIVGSGFSALFGDPL